MAGVSTGAATGSRRSVDQDVNMVPFIDLLMVTISFLLVTAVWTRMAQLPAAARAPGQRDCCAAKEEAPALRVDVRGDGRVALQWQKGARTVELEGATSGDLAATLTRVRASGVATGLFPDAEPTAAILRVPAALPMAEVTSIMDAIRAPRLPDGAAAFAITFSTS